MTHDIPHMTTHSEDNVITRNERRLNLCVEMHKYIKERQEAGVPATLNNVLWEHRTDGTGEVFAAIAMLLDAGEISYQSAQNCGFFGAI